MFFSSVKVDASKIIFYLFLEQERSKVEMLHQQSVPVIVPLAPGIIGENIYISSAPPPRSNLFRFQAVFDENFAKQ